MEKVVEKINVHASINDLKVGGRSLELPRWDGKTGHKPSSIRSNAAKVAGDYKRKYKVAVTENTIIVTRLK